MTILLRAVMMEFKKIKRTIILWAVLAAPLLVGGVQFLILLNRDEIVTNIEDPWLFLDHAMSNVWALMIYPLLIALITSLLSSYEHDNQKWKILFSLPVNRHNIYIAKFITANILLLSANLILSGLYLANGYLMIILKPEFGFANITIADQYIWKCLKFYLASMLIISFHHWLAVRFKSFAVVMGVGVAGTFMGMVQATVLIQKYFPWKYPINVQVTNPGFQETALILGIAGGIILLILGSIHITRRDVL